MQFLYKNIKLSFQMVQANSSLLADLESARAAKLSASYSLQAARADEREVMSRGNATEGQEGRAEYATRQA